MMALRARPTSKQRPLAVTEHGPRVLTALDGGREWFAKLGR